MSKGTLMLNGVDYSNAGGGGSMVNYSTEEQVIGTWIDGKKLYQKTIVFTVSATGWTNYNHGISNIKFMKIENAVGDFEDNTFYNIPFFRTSSVYTSISMTTSTIDIYVSASQLTNFTAYATIQYTKTTD